MLIIEISRAGKNIIEETEKDNGKKTGHKFKILIKQGKGNTVVIN